jgi:hypothetical protein
VAANHPQNRRAVGDEWVKRWHGRRLIAKNRCAGFSRRAVTILAGVRKRRCSVCGGYLSTPLPFHRTREKCRPPPPHGQAPRVSRVKIEAVEKSLGSILVAETLLRFDGRAHAKVALLQSLSAISINCTVATFTKTCSPTVSQVVAPRPNSNSRNRLESSDRKRAEMSECGV